MTDMTPNAARCCDEYDDYRNSQRVLRQSRRGFLKTTIGALAAAPIAPHLLLKSSLASRMGSTSNSDPILVVIQLAGGNDGLNTIVPYASDLYYQDRPNIAVPAKSVLPIDNTVGFNPNLGALKPLFDQKKLAVIQGVGYPDPNRSHFRSTSIWESADPVGNTPTGWLGRYLDDSLADTNNPMIALALGPMVPQTLMSERVPVPSMESVNTFKFLVNGSDAKSIMDAYRRMYGGSSKDLPPYMGLIRAVEKSADVSVQDLQSVSTNYHSTVQYPQNPLSQELQLVSQIIASGIGTRVFHVSIGGFDDHVAEVYTHARILKDFADSVSAFYQDMEAQGRADQVLIMTFSEFGRRVKENAGRGTDHGTAAPVFVLGGKVNGGLYGQDPILTNLDDNGDLVYDVDFRSIYGTVIDRWMGGSSSKVLNGSFESLPIL